MWYEIIIFTCAQNGCSEEKVRVIVREGSPGGRSESTVGRICETGSF